MITSEECRELMVDSDKFDSAIKEIEGVIRYCAECHESDVYWRIPSDIDFHTYRAIIYYLKEHAFFIEEFDDEIKIIWG